MKTVFFHTVLLNTKWYFIATDGFIFCLFPCSFRELFPMFRHQINQEHESAPARLAYFVASRRPLWILCWLDIDNHQAWAKESGHKHLQILPE